MKVITTVVGTVIIWTLLSFIALVVLLSNTEQIGDPFPTQTYLREVPKNLMGKQPSSLKLLNKDDTGIGKVTDDIVKEQAETMEVVYQLQAMLEEMNAMRAEEVNAAPDDQKFTELAAELSGVMAQLQTLEAGLEALGEQLKEIRCQQPRQLSSYNKGRLVFSINTGRSGSNYLANVLNTLENVKAYHEPGPSACAYPQQGFKKLSETYSARRTLKTKLINDAMGKFPGQVYAETCPNFKLWMWDIILDEYGCDFLIDILVIRRYIPATLKSIYELGYYNGRTGTQFCPTANHPNSFSKALASDDHMDPYEKIISYLINTEAFTEFMMKKFGDWPNIRFFEYRAESMYTFEGSYQIVKDLGLTPTNDTFKLMGEVSDKYCGKSKHKQDTELAYCEQRTTTYVRQCAERGIPVTNLPQLEPFPGYVYDANYLPNRCPEEADVLHAPPALGTAPLVQHDNMDQMAPMYQPLQPAANPVMYQAPPVNVGLDDIAAQAKALAEKNF